MSNLLNCTLSVTCANIELLLQELINDHIEVDNIEYIDDISISIKLSVLDIKHVIQISRKLGAKVSIINRSWLHRFIKPIIFHPVLLAGIVLIIGISILISKTVLFVFVEGNETVKTYEILNQAENSGLSFGVVRSQINSEQIKNDLLEKIPTLQWVGINTSGCVATISIKERQPSVEENSYSIPAGIIAVKEGVICSVSSTKGDVKCKVGQAVNKGDLLISAYKEYEKVTVFCGAKGEVFADTVNELRVLTPAKSSNRVHKDGSHTNVSIIFGKKLINLFKDSRILHTECAKMYEQRDICLPGGFSLPIKLCYVYIQCYSTEPCFRLEAPWLSSCGRNYLLGKMISGKVLDEQIIPSNSDNYLIINMKLTCCEMIGKTKAEEISIFNGKDQRADR